MTYLLWHDKSKKRVNIHKDDCGNLEKLGGDRTQSPYYGPYCPLVTAPNFAARIALGLIVLLAVLGAALACDSLTGACYLGGEKITKVIDANGNEYKVQPHSHELLGRLQCAVSAKAIPFEGDRFNRYFEVSNGTETVKVKAYLNLATGKFIPLAATWE